MKNRNLIFILPFGIFSAFVIWISGSQEGTGDPRAGGVLSQRISLAIQRGDAASMLGTMGGDGDFLGIQGSYITNLSEACLRCLCYVSTKCDLSHGCTAGYCGPFNISRVYWVDAGKVVLEEDQSERNHAWEDCARSYHCAKRIIGGYLEKFGKDCNGDGVTNCFDYMMINGNGGYGCTAPLNRSENGRRWLQRYEECYLN